MELHAVRRVLRVAQAHHGSVRVDPGRNRDGPAPHEAPDVRRAVPSGVRADERRQEDPGQLRAPRCKGRKLIEAIAKLVKCQNLTEEEAGAAFEIIMRGDATPSQIAGFLVALRMKGETAEEITG